MAVHQDAAAGVVGGRNDRYGFGANVDTKFCAACHDGGEVAIYKLWRFV